MRLRLSRGAGQDSPWLLERLTHVEAALAQLAARIDRIGDRADHAPASDVPPRDAP